MHWRLFANLLEAIARVIWLDLSIAQLVAHTNAQ